MRIDAAISQAKERFSGHRCETCGCGLTITECTASRPKDQPGVAIEGKTKCDHCGLHAHFRTFELAIMTTLPRLYFASRQAWKRYLAQEQARAGAPFRKSAQPEPTDWKADSASADGLFPDAEAQDPGDDQARIGAAADEGAA